MSSCVFRRKFFLETMSQKRITSFFTNPDSSKRKFASDENESSKIVKKLTAEKILTIKFGHFMDTEAKSDSKVDTLIGKSWLIALEKEFNADYFKKLCHTILKEKLKYEIYPPVKDIFSWTTMVPITDVKVVILGQDPYIRAGQAHGLAFSVRKGIDIPKSLINIYTELTKDIPGFVRPTHGCLNGWARQGVLLLNSCLTVRAGQSDSHKNLGWELFTNAVIEWINGNLENVVFMLWGNNAKAKGQFITLDKHLVLTAAHPSPLSASRGFFGCRHFSKANKYLQESGKQEIDWTYLP